MVSDDKDVKDGEYEEPTHTSVSKDSSERGTEPETGFDTCNTASSMEKQNINTNSNKSRSLTVTSADGYDIGTAHDLISNQVPRDVETEEKSGETDETKLQAPDGGYGWFVVFGSFLCHLLMGGMGRSDGLFFLMFESRFHMSATLTAWPGSIVDTLRLGMGPLASAICQRWSVRTCCMIGGLVSGFAQIVTAFNTNFYVLFISHGIFQGIGRGLLYGPSVILINMYFENRRSLATGLAASGVGVGTLVMVPLIQFLFDTYSFEGGFLVLGAICFHGVLMAMLFRPLFLHYKFIGKRGHVMEKPSPSETVMLSEMTEAGDTASIRSVRLRSSISQDVETFREARQGLIQNRLTVETLKQHSVASQDQDTISRTIKKESFWKSTINILFPVERKDKNTHDSDGEKNKLFHFELLRDPAFLSFCLSLGIFTATFKSTFTFMPALAKACGLTNSQAVFILSFSGVLDTTGRILFGFLMDRPSLRKHRLVVCSCINFLLAGLCALMPVLGSSFVWLCTISSFFGMLTGILASQKSVVCVDLLSAKLMPSAFGILLLFQAVGVCVGPLLSGIFRDAFGRFHEAFFLGAGLMAVSACLMVYSTVLHTLNKRRAKNHLDTA